VLSAKRSKRLFLNTEKVTLCSFTEFLRNPWQKYTEHLEFIQPALALRMTFSSFLKMTKSLEQSVTIDW